MDDPTRVCYSFSTRPSVASSTGQRVGYSDFVCSGTAEQLYWKVRRGVCTSPSGAPDDVSTMSYNEMRDLFLNDASLQQECSDGGFGSVAVRVGKIGVQYVEPTFGCDYGSQVLVICLEIALRLHEFC